MMINKYIPDTLLVIYNEYTLCIFSWVPEEYTLNICVESDILGPIDYFSDIDNLVSFERGMFADYNFKY